MHDPVYTMAVPNFAVLAEDFVALGVSAATFEEVPHSQVLHDGKWTVGELEAEHYHTKTSVCRSESRGT